MRALKYIALSILNIFNPTFAYGTAVTDIQAWQIKIEDVSQIQTQEFQNIVVMSPTSQKIMLRTWDSNSILRFRICDRKQSQNQNEFSIENCRIIGRNAGYTKDFLKQRSKELEKQRLINLAADIGLLTVSTIAGFYAYNIVSPANRLSYIATGRVERAYGYAKKYLDKGIIGASFGFAVGTAFVVGRSHPDFQGAKSVLQDSIQEQNNHKLGEIGVVSSPIKMSQLINNLNLALLEY